MIKDVMVSLGMRHGAGCMSAFGRLPFSSFRALVSATRTERKPFADNEAILTTQYGEQ
jgi:hypothetical protein